MNKNILKAILLFIIGGCIYVTIEVFYRSRSHWTMWLLGGFAFFGIGLINEFKLTWDMPLVKQGLIGGIYITVLEFITGCIVNLLLGWNVWDYSNLPGNICGQVCIQFTVIWFFLAIVAVILDDTIRWKVMGEEKPHYFIFYKRSE